MKVFILLAAVLLIAFAVQAETAVPFLTSLSSEDSTAYLVWLKAGAGVETPVAALDDPVTVFEPVLTIEPVGFLYYLPTTPFKYAELSILLNATGTNNWPHAGFAVHAGPYVAAGLTWDKSTNYFYLSSEEAVTTVFNWLGMGLIRKI